MKYLSLLLVVSAFAVAQPEISGEFGGQGYFPGTDDILDTYTYGSSVLGTIPASFGDYRTVDEFVATQNANLTKFTYWGLSTTTNPSSLNLMCFANNAGVPSSTPTFETSYPVTVVNSGFTFGSYTVYYAQMTVSLSIVAGTQWWGFQRPGADTWYVGVGSVVEGYEAYRTLGAGYSWQPCSGSIGACDMFKIIEGAYLAALDRSTWGEIKHQF
jgi:hypothetical protein